MALLLADRAVTTCPLPVLRRDEARLLHIPLRDARHLRIRSGAYVDRAAYRKLPPWQRYAVRVHAFTRCHPEAVLCLESAAVLHGLPLFGETRDIHIYDPGRKSSRRFGDVVVHTSADPREVIALGGIPVTSLIDTAVDLGRVLPPAHALAVVDAVISPAQGGPLDTDALRNRSLGQANGRGRASLRWVWANADGRSESPGESISRAVIEWSGFERPDIQQEFHYEGSHDRADFFFRSHGVIGESDGWQKYRLQDPEHAARTLTAEKRREDRLRRHGHPFARWDLADAMRVAPLVQALQAAGVPRVRPSQPLFLASLSRRPREKPHSS